MSLAIVNFMNLNRFEIVLKSARRIVAALMMVGLFAWSASAQSGRGPFGGVYVGADASKQHVIGGSLVDGVDTLQEGQASRLNNWDGNSGTPAACFGVRRARRRFRY